MLAAASHPSSPQSPAAEAPLHGPPRLPPVVRVGRCELHLNSRTLRVEGVARPVRRKVFDLILLLVQRHPAAVPRDEILDHVWPPPGGSPAVLARTVLEARRALGDAPDAPALIVTVRGIGYRFAGTWQPGPASATTSAIGRADAGTPGDVQRALRQAERAFDQDNDPRGARRHAEQALAMAERQALGAERAKALAWCAWLAMHDDDADTAARQAAEALASARAEQSDAALALALLSDAFVRLMAGDLGQALHGLQQAHALLDDVALAGRRYHCENLLAGTFRELDDLAQAQAWCARAQDTALAAGLFPQAQRAVGNLVTLKLFQGDALQARADADGARQAWEDGVQWARKVLRSAFADRDPWIGMGALGNLAALLARLGRPDEARQHFSALEDALLRAPGPGGPTLWQRQLLLHCERARMESACQRHSLAWTDLQCALRLLDQHAVGYLRPTVYRCAVTVLERAGRYREALAWASKEREAATAMRKDQAAKLAVVLQAEAATRRLRQDAHSARQQMDMLAREARDLRAQSRRLQALLPRAAGSGLLDEAHVLPCMALAWHDARERGWPYCVALVRVDNATALSRAQGPAALSALLQSLGQALHDHDSPCAGHWGADGLLCVLDNRGRDAAVRALQDALQAWEARSLPAMAGGLQPRLRATVRDAAADASLDATVSQLAALQGSDCAWPMDEVRSSARRGTPGAGP